MEILIVTENLTTRKYSDRLSALEALIGQCLRVLKKEHGEDGACQIVDDIMRRQKTLFAPSKVKS